MIYNNRAIQSLLERTESQPLNELCHLPAVQAVYRVCAYYADGHAYHSVATMICRDKQQTHQLQVVYDGLFDHKPISKRVSDDDYQSLIKMLRKARFDSLHEQADIFTGSQRIWCVERAAGSLHHQVLLSPDKPDLPYSLIINAISDYIPHAVRTIEK